MYNIPEPYTNIQCFDGPKASAQPSSLHHPRLDEILRSRRSSSGLCCIFVSTFQDCSQSLLISSDDGKRLCRVYRCHPLVLSIPSAHRLLLIVKAALAVCVAMTHLVDFVVMALVTAVGMYSIVIDFNSYTLLTLFTVTARRPFTLLQIFRTLKFYGRPLFLKRKWSAFKIYLP